LERTVPSDAAEPLTKFGCPAPKEIQSGELSGDLVQGSLDPGPVGQHTVPELRAQASVQLANSLACLRGLPPNSSLQPGRPQRGALG